MEPKGRKQAAPKAVKAKTPRKGTRKSSKTAEGALDVLNAQNEKVRDITLSPEIFGAAVNEHLLYESVKQYRAGARRGTHMTKNRALVSGSGRKPWRQKGTGRARVGEIRTPLWRHGGTVFGPVPRDYSYSMPKKARAAALRSALSQKAKEGAVRIVEDFEIKAPKTRELKELLDRLGVSGPTLIVDHEPPEALVLSGRNIPGLTVRDESHLTVYDLLDCKTVLFSHLAIGKLEERLTP